MALLIGHRGCCRRAQHDLVLLRPENMIGQTHHEQVYGLFRLPDGQHSIYHNVRQLIRQLLIQLCPERCARHTAQQLSVIRIRPLLEGV